MNKLIVLIGRPGCGKSTLVKEFLKENLGYTDIDVWTYIKVLQTEEGVPEDKIFDRYKLMYDEIELLNQDIILEIGTNFFEFNINRLHQLSNTRNVYPVFCLLDTNICRERCLERKKRNSRQHKNMEALEIRLKKVFPDNHQKLADKLGLEYYELDMLKPMEERIKFLENLSR